jgi:threonyl-tRNA synthetase
VWSAIGREFTLATNQVDFAIPTRFGLVYVDENNKGQTPLCIHRAPLGTHERFVGFLLEHFGGDFPLWLAPKQVIILPISDKYLSYANELENKLFENDIRVSVDGRSEKMGAKIRDAEINKIPIMLIVGEKEENDGSASVRRRHTGDLGSTSVDKLIPEIVEEIINRRRA